MATKTRKRAKPKGTRVKTRAQSTAHISTTKYDDAGEKGEVKSKTGTRPVTLDGDAFAKVGVVGSVTRNMGDYNSIKVGVSIEMPCLPSESDAIKTYIDTSDLLDAMLQREYALAASKPVPQEVMERLGTQEYDFHDDEEATEADDDEL